MMTALTSFAVRIWADPPGSSEMSMAGRPFCARTPGCQRSSKARVRQATADPPVRRERPVSTCIGHNGRRAVPDAGRVQRGCWGYRTGSWLFMPTVAVTLSPADDVSEPLSTLLIQSTNRQPRRPPPDLTGRADSVFRGAAPKLALGPDRRWRGRSRSDRGRLSRTACARRY